MNGEETRVTQEEFDRWLDAALRAHVDAEPRMGLEDRVLARLASKPPRRGFAWRPLASAVAAVLAIAIALILMHPGKRHQNLASRVPQPAKHSESPGNTRLVRTPPVVAGNNPEPQKHLRLGTRRDTACCVSTKTNEPRVLRSAKQQLPMLATFPAFRPETEEEHLLAHLAAQGGPFDVAQLHDHPLPQFKIQPMEETPADYSPQE